jgi:hypothetical protein
MSIAKRNGTLTCVILDLDETLINTRRGKAEMNSIQTALKDRGEIDRYYEFTLEGVRYRGVKRSYYRYCIDWLFANIDVIGVWTAAEADYAREVVKVLFPKTNQPHFVWSRDECVESKGLYYKPLASLYAAFPDLDRDNTIIVDDRRDIAVYNPDSLLEIPAYNYKNPLTYDRALVVVVEFFRDALNSGISFRSIDKTRVIW